MGLYEVVLRQSYFDQQVINRFHYLGSGTPGLNIPAFGLISALGFIGTGSPVVYPSGSLFALLRPIQSTTLSYIEVEARNLYDPLDFWVRPFPSPTVGTSGGEATAPFMATGFKSTRVRTDIGRGFKRFAGITEPAVAAGGLLDAGVLASLAPLADELGATQSFTDGATALDFQPIVMSFEEYTTPRGNRAYKQYATEAEQLDHIAIGIQYTAMPAVRSQVSRQYGRGA